MKPSARRFIEVFNEAKTFPPAVEREQFLAFACGEDDGLRQRVVKLLLADALVGAFLSQPTLTLSPTSITEHLGEVVGPYQLVEKLGEGGCGVVYLASQEHPVRRRVALKIIKLGMDTREMVARFEGERQLSDRYR